MAYKRILLKLSGEVLAGGAAFGIDSTESLFVDDMARNLTPALARVLREVNPDDAGMSRRAARNQPTSH